MAGLIEQILGLATIEQIEAEQQAHRAAIAELQKKLDALDQVLSILVIARDGKPPRKTRKSPGSPRRAEATDSAEATDEVPLVQTLNANQQAIIRLLEQEPPMSMGEIAHAIKVTYSSVYSAVNKLIELGRLVKEKDKITVAY